MTHRSMTPATLRAVLASALFVLAALGVTIYILGYGQIARYSADTQKLASEAEASNSDLTNLIATRKQLDSNADIVDRTSMMVAESRQYAYQDQILSDLKTYGAAAGISVSNITFSDASLSSATATSTPATGSTLTTPSGIKSIKASVTIENPVAYANVLKFVHLLEQGLFKMRLTEISISRSNDQKSAGSVSINTLTMEVFIRS